MLKIIHWLKGVSGWNAVTAAGNTVNLAKWVNFLSEFKFKLKCIIQVINRFIDLHKLLSAMLLSMMIKAGSAITNIWFFFHFLSSFEYAINKNAHEPILKMAQKMKYLM